MMNSIERRLKVSVVIPTFRRPVPLERCLAALARQDLPHEQFEVLVVDDGSAIPPRDIVSRFAAGMNVRLIEQANSGPATARNKGAAEAHGELLAFTDDDCVPDPDWLTALTMSSAGHPGAAVGGRIINALGDGLFSTASQVLIEYLYEYYNDENESARFFITSNLAFPAESFRQSGGFDRTFPLAAAEDRDMCDRWREDGLALVFDPNAIVRHRHALGLRAFIRQHFTYGRGAHHLHRARAKRGMAQIQVEPMQFYTRLILYPMRVGAGLRAPLLSILMLVSQAAYASGYFLERWWSRHLEPGA